MILNDKLVQMSEIPELVVMAAEILTNSDMKSGNSFNLITSIQSHMYTSNITMCYVVNVLKCHPFSYSVSFFSGRTARICSYLCTHFE